MQIPGHLAVALATHTLLPFFRFQLDAKGENGSRRLLIPLLTASLLPDVVDKTIGYIFHLMPNGRHYAHNLFSLGGSSLLVWLIWGRVTGLAWFAGYLGHLLADSSRPVPWLFPLRKYPFKKGQLKFEPDGFLSETILLVLMLIVRQLDRLGPRF
jgi:hypothetical protein